MPLRGQDKITLTRGSASAIRAFEATQPELPRAG